MNSKEKLKVLHRFDEEQLIDNVIVPLLEHMGFRDITKMHGPGEQGIDLLFYRETEFGYNEYTGVQAKKEKIHGKAGKSGNATEILIQAQQAFSYTFIDVYDGKQKNIDKFFVITSGDIIPSAKKSIEDQLIDVGKQKIIRFVDGRKLVSLIDTYMPSFFWEEYDHFNKYFNAMKKDFETIKDISAIGQREPVSLERIYVSLKVSEKPKEEFKEKEIADRKIPEEEYRLIEEEKRRREQIFDADTVIHKFRKAVIVGGPGSGKTTLLKHLTLKSCKENLKTQERTIVPVFITLRQYSESGKDLREYINDVFERYNFPKAKKFIEEDLKNGKCLLFLDGFDELASTERQKTVTEDIETFIRKYPGNQVVVTSRIAGYHDELKGFEKLELMLFDDHQITQFITNWFGKSNPAKAKSMGEAIKENEKIRELARNPLLIAIIAVIYEEDRQLPQRRVKLYERCVEVLLSKWDVAHRIKNKYDAEAKQKILRKLALEAHIQKRRSFTKEELLKKFKEYLPEVRIKKDEAEDFLAEIVQRNVLLKEISIGVYDFLHLSFQEYLAALELRERKDYDTLLTHLYDPWWEEAVLLFAGFDRDATELLQKIKEKEREDERFKENMFCRNLILMGKCIADADYTSAQLRDQIVDDLWSLYQTAEFSSLRGKAMKIISFIKPDNIIDSLIEELKDEDSPVRWRAAEALGRIGSEKAVDPLIEALTDEEHSVRGSAAEALGKIGSERAVDLLIEALTDEDSSVRGSAAIALGRIGSEKVVDLLIEALSDEDSSVRWRAAYALGEIGSEKVVDLLIEALSDEKSSVRRSAASALETIGSEKAVDPLIAALKDEDSDVRGYVTYPLGRIGSEKVVDPLIAALKDEDGFVRLSAASALETIGSEKAVDSLIAALKDEDSDVRWSAAGPLGRIGSERAVDPLIAALKDEDSSVREKAAEGLGMTGSERAVDLLIEALSDEDSSVRWRAAEALGRIGSERAVDLLIEALSDEDSSVRWRAAEALGRIGSERAVDLLIEALSDEDSSVRWRAAEALGRIGSERAVDPLIEALTDKNISVRWSAASALGEIGSERAVDPLKNALKDEGEGILGKVKDQAFDSLEKISRSSGST